MKEKSNMITNQHGDLLLQKICNIPDEAKIVKTERDFVLEKGEGVHTHVLECNDNCDVYELDSEIFLSIKKDIKLIHEEHGVQIIKPGSYKKVIEREWDYESEEARRTLD